MPIPGGYGQINYRITGSPLPTGAEVTLGVDVQAYTLAPDDLAEDAFGWWGTHVMPNLTNHVQLEEVRVKYGPDATGPSGAFTGSSVGGQGLETVPPNTAALVTKQTALGGRAGRGRMFIPGIPETKVSEAGVLDTEYQGNFQDDLDAMVTAMTAGNLGLVVLHQPGSPLTTPTPITRLFLEGSVATQRLRLRR